MNPAAACVDTFTSSPSARAAEIDATSESPVAEAVRIGLTSRPRWLPAWLFYDAEGSRLFERITQLPEYYPTRTERGILAANADSMIASAFSAYHQATGNGHITADGAGKLRLLELGAGTASKTGILLASAVRAQGETLYLPVDVSETALQEASDSLARTEPLVRVEPQLANYVSDPLHIPPHDGPTLALYIGSSIGNFAPDEAVAVLRNLHAQLRSGDTLLLGTDLVKDSAVLEAAYCDEDGITEAFNLNLLRRLNRELGANFDLANFRHVACFNRAESRIEMHLKSARNQQVRFPALNLTVSFAAGETIHTENSYKFTEASIAALLRKSHYRAVSAYADPGNYFAVTLATPFAEA